ncbi:peptidoglycan hydrolase-like protein with peptidoglycan-binding domain [Methylobacterium brachiatum]|jgi:peptidoglycan hydrolase-like protein with peptidoglycan-binding domain|uniref:Peptidoglycan hydrolase-like protein with peptidoglycan-binding domain n=1 Tax=Methylobacterium brachiatum TaxID=269660 RepID=A0AAJ1TM25_9HYPH|nr:peptidoglycan-binding protein [Methylobacterium brachiatum]MCB4800845.1 sel1 repeat family protein [Methylobacterium brachiatum]MDQ0541389.1 peptidoglycan hydrolase-like protein with peptidoglycan-binding domain [Methylobacterium brachiatum]
MSGTDRVRAHAALWYADARYRLAWLVLPQAAVALAAGLALAVLKPTGEWGKPADSKEDEKLYHELLDKAGKDGDKAAFDKLKAGADAGNISARSFLGTLYNPEWASLYPKSPVKADAAKALTYYQQPADLGYPGAQRGMTELLLNRGRGQYDLKRGCRYGLAFYGNPAAIRDNHFDSWSTLFWIAGCYIDSDSGVPRDAQKAADIYMDTVAAKLPLSVTTFTDDLGRQPPDLVAAIQRNLARRGFYSGPADGSATPQTLAAVRALAGKAAGTGGGNTGRPAGNTPPAPPSGPKPTVEELIALAKSATTNAADEAKLRDLAEGGTMVAQYLYAQLLSPTNTVQRITAPDAARAIQYFERLAREASFAPAATSAAFLYDIGAPNLPRDPEKAADMTIRALELKDADILKNIEEDKWGAGFWAALQQRLAQRNLYQGRILDQRNDRTVQAARSLLGKQ